MWYKRLSSEKGLAAMEFVVVIPFLLILMMSVVEISWYALTCIRAEQCTRVIARNVMGPSASIMNQERLSGTWNLKARGRKPDWLTQKEKAAWNFDSYDGWMSFGKWSDKSTSAGEWYFALSGDRKEKFRDRMESKMDYLQSSRFSYEIKGGWYVKSMGPGMPSSYGTEWKSIWNVDRARQYYADVVVETVYRYQPFSLVGRVLLGAEKTGIREIRSKEHCHYPVGEVWRN